MNELNGKSENLEKAQETKGSSEIVIRDKQNKKKVKYFAIAAITSFILGGIIPTLGEQPRHPLLIIGFLFLSLVLAPLLGIIACVVYLRARKFTGCLFLILLILFLTVALIVHGRIFLVQSLPYIYTPPALTPKNLPVYNECIKFVRKNDDYKNLRLLRRGWVCLNDNFYGTTDISLKEIFPEDEITEIKTLVRKLRSVKCDQFQRHDDMLLFYKAANAFLPVYPEEVFSLFPVSPGVLYSLTGENPNEVDSEVLNAAKPFTKIAGNWYISRHLLLVGLRSDGPVSIPESLIDHSLRTEGLILGDVDE